MRLKQGMRRSYRPKMEFLVCFPGSAAEETPAFRFPEDPCQVWGTEDIGFISWSSLLGGMDEKK